MIEVQERKKISLENPLGDYLPYQDEAMTVHFYFTSHNIPRSTDQFQEFKPKRVLNRMYPIDFVNTFGWQYSANDRFYDVTTPGIIYSIAKHMDESLFRERYEDKIDAWKETQKGHRLKKRIAQELEAVKRIHSNSRQYIASYKDILWIPPNDATDLDYLVNNLPDYV